VLASGEKEGNREKRMTSKSIIHLLSSGSGKLWERGSKIQLCSTKKGKGQTHPEAHSLKKEA